MDFRNIGKRLDGLVLKLSSFTRNLIENIEDKGNRKGEEFMKKIERSVPYRCLRMKYKKAKREVVDFGIFIGYTFEEMLYESIKNG
jgi:hypothetical protein